MNIFLAVKTRSHSEKIEKIDTTHYKVNINIAPEKGKANERVIQILATYFNIPKSRISILSGHTSRNKIMQII